MNWYREGYDDPDPPTGECESCGQALDDDPDGDHDDTHRLCWGCWREQNGEEVASDG